MTVKNKRRSKNPGQKSTGLKISHRAKHLVVPHKANRYQPHLIRARGLVGLAAVVLLLQLGYSFVSDSQIGVLGQTTTTSISQLLADTNSSRIKHHVPPLKLSSKLDQAAYAKAQDMFRHNYWAHVSPSGVQPWHWLGVTDYNYNRAGENLAKNYTSSQAVTTAWLNSPEHRANLLNKQYQDVGFAVVNGSLSGQDTSLVVAFYGQPESSAVLAASAPTQRFSKPTHQTASLLTTLGKKFQAMNPATLGAIILLLGAVMVAIFTYANRRKLPRSVQTTWRSHHAAYKAAGLLSVVVMLVAATHSGQV